MKTIIVYYSAQQHTKKLAEQLAKTLGKMELGYSKMLPSTIFRLSQKNYLFKAGA